MLPASFLRAKIAGLPALSIPTPIREALEAGATLVVSISSGKDSQALARALKHAHTVKGWPGKIVAVHADLGMAEWAETPAQVIACAEEVGLELVCVQRTGGGLVERIEERAVKLAGTGKPVWPSSQNRYCTSDLKRNPIDTYLRTLGGLVVSAEGVRAGESRERAKKPAGEVRLQITGKRLQDVVKAAYPAEGKPTAEHHLQGLAEAWAAYEPGAGRLALTWRPLLNWEEADVWKALGTSLPGLESRRRAYKLGAEDIALDGWEAHPAYVYGNQRLSCALCVLGCLSDLKIGAARHPELLARYIKIEEETGTTFRQDMALSDLLK